MPIDNSVIELIGRIPLAKRSRLLQAWGVRLKFRES